jgi:hypothetical protein
MKKLLLAIAFAAMATVASYAQGTIAFGNSIGTAIKIQGPGIAIHNITAADQAQYNIAIGVYYGAAGATDLTQVAPGTGVIGTTAGVMASLVGANVLGLYAIPGTSADGGSVVSLQIKAWNTATGEQYVVNSTPRDVTTGPAAGPATVIWQGATATNPNRFIPLIITIVPEPSTIALGVLGLGSLLLFRRRQAK